jgi:hypothetical protein
VLRCTYVACLVLAIGFILCPIGECRNMLQEQFLPQHPAAHTINKQEKGEEYGKYQHSCLVARRKEKKKQSLVVKQQFSLNILCKAAHIRLCIQSQALTVLKSLIYGSCTHIHMCVCVCVCVHIIIFLF